MPFVAQVAVGKRPGLRSSATTTRRPDGSGVRDYLHVQDLAEGHVAACATCSAAASRSPSTSAPAAG
jgi:UDP-glucose 4-epimerase